MSKKFAAKIILSFLTLGFFLLPFSTNFDKNQNTLAFNTTKNTAEAQVAPCDASHVTVDCFSLQSSNILVNNTSATLHFSVVNVPKTFSNTYQLKVELHSPTSNTILVTAMSPVIHENAALQSIAVVFGQGTGTTPDIDLTPGTSYIGNITLVYGNNSSNPVSSVQPAFTQFTTTSASTNPTNTATVANGASATGGNGTPAGFDFGCKGLSPSTWFTNCIGLTVYYIIFIPISLVAHLAAILLDFFVNYSTNSSSYGVGGFVAVGWAAVRDIANIFFIIGLLAVAIQTILGIGHHTKQMIGYIILAAMLINFSLFFSQVVIDGTNILAKVFYNHISVTDASGGELALGSNGEKQISVQIMSAFNPQDILGQKQYDAMTGSGTGLGGIGKFIFIVLLCSAIVLYTAYIFFSVAILFVSRVAMLCLLMVFSPIAFASYALPFHIPGLGHEDWWDQLLKNAFLAPIFIFFLYIILILVNALKATNFVSSSTDTGIAGGFGVVMATMIPFLIITILLMKAKEMAEEYAGEMGHAVGGIGGKLATAAVGGTIGAYATLGRATLGRVGDKISNSSTVRDLGATKYGGWLGKGIQNAGKAVGNASFDVRGAGIAGVGAAAVGGFTAVKERQVNDRKQRAKDLEESAYSKSQKDIDKAKAEVHTQEAHAAPAIHDLNTKIEDKNAKIEEIKKKIIEPEEKNIANTEKAVKDAERNLKVAVDTHGQGSPEAKNAGIEVQKQVNLREKAIERKKEIEDALLKPETAQLEFLIQDLKKLNEPIKKAKNNLHHAEQAQTDINHARRSKYASNIEFVEGNRNPLTQFVTVITGGSVMANNKGANEVRAAGQPSGHSDDHGGGGKKRPPFKGKKTGGHGAPAGGHDDHH